MRHGRLQREEIKSLKRGLEEVRKKQEGEKTKQDKSRIRVYILIAVIVAAVAVSAYFSITAKVIAEDGTYDKFVKCLSSKSLVLFGSADCEYCNSLKSAFGQSSNFLSYIDCSKDKSRCGDVKEYPMWHFSGQYLRGNFSLQELSIITKCIL